MSSLARILATLLGIVVGSAAAFAGQEIRFKGPRSFGTVQPQAVVSEDFDGDGHLDVVGIDDGTPYFFRGDGHGSYAEEVVSTPQLDVEPGDAVAADFDGDGHLDVVVCTLETPGGVYPFLGNGDGTFVEAPVIASERSRRIVAADFDENGVDDVVVVHLDTGVLQVLLSNGDGTFTETSIATSGIETDLVAADFDGDGHADLAGLAESGGTTIEVRPGRGDGTFEEPVRTEVGGDHRGLVAVDVDLDSDLDLVLGDRFDFETYLNDGSGQFVEGSETLPLRS